MDDALVAVKDAFPVCCIFGSMLELELELELDLELELEPELEPELELNDGKRENDPIVAQERADDRAAASVQ